MPFVNRSPQTLQDFSKRLGPPSEALVFLRQQDGGEAAVRLGDQPQALALRCPVGREQAFPIAARGLVGSGVFLIDVAPIPLRVQVQELRSSGSSDIVLSGATTLRFLPCSAAPAATPPAPSTRDRARCSAGPSLDDRRLGPPSQSPACGTGTRHPGGLRSHPPRRSGRRPWRRYGGGEGLLDQRRLPRPLSRSGTMPNMTNYDRGARGGRGNPAACYGVDVFALLPAGRGGRHHLEDFGSSRTLLRCFRCTRGIGGWREAAGREAGGCGQIRRLPLRRARVAEGWHAGR